MTRRGSLVIRIALMVPLALLGACGSLLHTPYVAPQAQVPNQWQAPVETSSSVNTSDWWHNFNDPDLNKWIKEALLRNNDLAAATIKVHLAQLQADLADHQIFPTPSASIGNSYSRLWDQSSTTGGTSFLNNTTNSSQTLTETGSGSTTRSAFATGTIGYEADLWGKLGDTRDAAQWEAIATEQDRQSTALTLTGTVAKLYWQIAYLHERIKLSQQNITYTQKTLDLVKVQHNAGASSELEVAQAEQNLQSQQASDMLLQEQLEEAHNAIAILFDSPPQKTVIDPQHLPSQPLPSINAGLPSQLLSRRPDLHAAELRLRETLANVDATRASYLPTLSLTGSLGTSSLSLTNFLQNPLVTLGTGLTLPFLDWQTMQINIKVSKSKYEEAVVNFRQTLYQAFSDVENALSARAHYSDQTAILERSLSNAFIAEHLAETRYRTGYTTLQSWLDAQETRRSSEDSLLETRFNLLTSYVTLYEALGGDSVAK